MEVVHELDEPDEMCPSCGGDLEPMAGQFEEADEIDVVERSFRIVRHKRQKYRCRCGAGIETALGPDKLVAGGRYSIDVAVDVAIAKFRSPRRTGPPAFRASTSRLRDRESPGRSEFLPTDLNFGQVNFLPGFATSPHGRRTAVWRWFGEHLP